MTRYVSSGTLPIMAKNPDPSAYLEYNGLFISRQPLSEEAGYLVISADDNGQAVQLDQGFESIQQAQEAIDFYRNWYQTKR